MQRLVGFSALAMMLSGSPLQASSTSPSVRRKVLIRLRFA